MKGRGDMSVNEFEAFKQELLNCRRCAHQFEHTPRPIFQGNQNANIMQISQAPSRKVMESGLPFHDLSGKRLKQDWYQITDDCFYDPANFYIASIARCYPGKAKRSGDNPPPTICAERFLKRELTMIHPKLYLVIGSYAAKWLFPDEDMLSLVFKNHTFQGKPLFVLPHPSPLNRRWLNEHPQFENERIADIRKQIHIALQGK